MTVLMKDGLEDQLSGKVIGSLHTSSAIGSVLGTLITTFWFIPLFNIYTVINIFVVMIVVAYLLYFWTKTTKYRWLLLSPILLLFLPYVYSKVESSDIVYHTTSLYHDIYVFETEDFNGRQGPFGYLTFGNKTTIQGMIDLNRPDELVLDYANSIWEISNTLPKRVKMFLLLDMESEH